MKRTITAFSAAILALVLCSPASADDETTISITVNLEIMTVSIPEITSSALHDPETAKMLSRAAKLARYAACEFVRRDDSLPCSRLLE